MTVIVSLLTAILTMGMDSAQSFYFFEQKDGGKEAQKKVVSAILQWRVTWGLGIVILAGASAPLINTWFFGGELPWIYFGVSFAGALFTTVMSQSVEIFRLLYRPWSYISVIVSKTVLAAATTLVLVLVFEQGIFSFFLGALISSAIVAVIGWYRVREYLDVSNWYWDWWPRVLKFGAPLLPAGLAIYVMNTADRWFIQHYHGQDELGIYAVGAKFVLLMALVVDMFRKAWWPIAMDAMHSDDGPETFQTISRMFIGFGTVAVVYLAFLSPWLVRWFTADAYHSAYPIVRVLAWKALFYGFYLVGSPGVWKSEKTHISALLMAGAGMVNILLNFLWVPVYAGVGAAMATSVSYLVLIMVTVFISERLWRVGFPVISLSAYVAIGVATVFWLEVSESSFWIELVVVHLCVILLAVFSFDRSMRGKIFAQVSRLIRFKGSET